MKVAIQLAIFACICSCVVSSYSSSSSTSTCLNYESDSSYKWCRYLTTTSTGNYCTSSDTSYACGGSPYDYRCSTDSSYLPQNSKKLLCPTDYTSCNSQTSYLYSSTDYSSLSSSYFGTSTICWYKFISSYSSIKSITIYLSSLTNASVEVYYESSTNTFNYKGSLSSGCSMDVNVTYDNPVWVLATPSSSSAYISVKGTASPSYGSTSTSCSSTSKFSSSSSYSSVSNYSESKYDLFTTIIILATIGSFTICLNLIVVSISSYYHSKNSKIGNEQEAVPNSNIHQEGNALMVRAGYNNQLNYPPNFNQSLILMNPNQIGVNQTFLPYQPQIYHPGMQAGFQPEQQNLNQVPPQSDTNQAPEQIAQPMINKEINALPPPPPVHPKRILVPLLNYHPVNENIIEEEKEP